MLAEAVDMKEAVKEEWKGDPRTVEYSWQR